MDIVMPLPTSLGNARLHWAQKLRAKKQFYAKCDQRQMLGLNPPPPAEPIRECTVNAHFRVHNRLDALLVKAAELCPARCIHPGKPRAGDASATAEMIERAEPFNA